jgi:hypothetical protein
MVESMTVEYTPCYSETVALIGLRSLRLRGMPTSQAKKQQRLRAAVNKVMASYRVSDELWAVLAALFALDYLLFSLDKKIPSVVYAS